MTARIDAAMAKANDALSELDGAVRTVREAIIAERCEPHPTQRKLSELEAFTRDLLGHIHRQATLLHQAGAHRFGQDLRRIAQQASARKAEILGEEKPDEHTVDVFHDESGYGVSCVCGWKAEGFPTSTKAREYGKAHLVALKTKTNGNGVAS